MNNKRIFMTVILFITCFFLGVGISRIKNASKEVLLKRAKEENWGLGFTEKGRPPTGNATADELKKYDAYYIGDTNEKIIYLTFDAGYENGNTPPILEALKKHQVPACFFLVGHYIEKNPELVKQMVEEGHMVANHTYSHPNMHKISSIDAFRKELEDLEVLYKEVVGQDMPRYYRPPQGKYNIENLKMAKELGYKTFFWSLAYVDWYNDKQPTREQALDKLVNRIHPGAIVLLHSTSKTNAEIMDELITKWKELGYSFGSLEDLVQ
ncbi:MAG TPA: polysaccharide deacetylase family protein [Clostridiales bacterium]|nr:polysaccharide deacetylase family protein [Clostridiales bacterium]